MTALIDAMGEAELQSHVITTCRQLGLPVYHTYDSRRSESGFPDLVIATPAGVTFALELKRAKPFDRTRRHRRAAQQRWIAMLDGTTVIARIVRPGDWPRVRDEIAEFATGGRVANPYLAAGVAVGALLSLVALSVGVVLGRARR